MANAYVCNLANVKCERPYARVKDKNKHSNSENLFVDKISNCPARESNPQNFNSGVAARQPLLLLAQCYYKVQLLRLDEINQFQIGNIIKYFILL